MLTRNPQSLREALMDSRQRTKSLVDDLNDEQLMGAKLQIVNPLRWELGHVAYFYERFVLAELGDNRKWRPQVDEWYDSFELAHELRWEIPLPSRSETLDYLNEVEDRVLTLLDRTEFTPQFFYLLSLAIYHEDMHGEAMTYTRQTLGYPKPHHFKSKSNSTTAASPHRDKAILADDLDIPAGTYWIGADPNSDFVFDNEKWAHPVELKEFAIAKTTVTAAEFLEFVRAGGYQTQEFWSPPGWRWVKKNQAQHPVYWRELSGQWHERWFDQWLPLREHNPMMHINWYEAKAYCQWAKRRLPSEAEWEVAAQQNWDMIHPHFALGQVWEWTESAFYPYPGFIVDTPYREYSAPWFGYPKVLRGGSLVTCSRMLRLTYRNFFLPHRNDVFAGLRTCRL